MLMMLVMGKAAPLLGTEVKRRGREGGKERDFVRKGRKERTNGEEESGAAAAAFLPSKGANGDAPGRAPPPAQDDRICEDETWAGERVRALVTW